MKSLSCKVGMILLSIGLFVLIRSLERSETKWINCYGRLPAYCNAEQQRIADTSKRFVGGWIQSGHKGMPTIRTGPRLGHRWYSKSESIPIILFVGVAVWGGAIIFILGLMLYRLVVEPLLIKKIKTE